MIRDPIILGKREARNRLVLPPIATYLCDNDGKVNAKHLEYYNARAKGGKIGVIFTEHTYITRQGMANEKQISASDDSDIPGLSLLAETFKRDGSLAILQMNHAGSAAPSEATGMNAVSASPVVLPVSPMMGDGLVPEELTQDGIRQIVREFAQAACRARAAGFDGAEIHSAHAYLLNQFYSPLTNHRTDAYGGTLENRVRFHLEVIQAVREAVGPDFILSLRLGGCDYMEGGSTISDAVQASKLFEEAGIDVISLSGGMCRYTRKDHKEPGYFSDMSSAVKKAVSIPVLLTGAVKTAEDAERILEEGSADLIGVGRSLLKNPNWANEQM